MFDVEANGKAVHEVTKLHSLVVQCLHSGEMLSCTDAAVQFPSIEQGIHALENADFIVAHNGISYDVPVLRKLRKFNPTGRVIDTLVISKVVFAHMKERDFGLMHKNPKFPKQLIGKHSLEAWGQRLGIHKGEFNGPWDDWSEEMQGYCDQDVRVLGTLLRYLVSRRWYDKEVMRVEHNLATYLSEGTRSGVPFDLKGAQQLASKIGGDRAALKQELESMFGCWLQKDKEFTPKRPNKARGYYAGAPMTKLKVVQFNPGSRNHIAKVLQEQYGWQPETFTETGKPEISEVTLEGAHYPPVPKLIEYLLLSKRLSNLETGPKAWMKFVDEHGLLHPTIYHNHAVTHRGGHKEPNVTQAPKVGNPYGVEWRSLVHAPKDWVQMGCDVSGLELRCLAHYLSRYDGGAYGKIVCDPTQKIHALHQQMMGGDVSYDVAKTWFYAYIYGAGDEKLGKIIDPSASPEGHKKLGRKYRNMFQRRMRAMGLLQDALAKKVTERGRIALIDGRPAHIRSPHAALNTLLQGTGSIICKNWIDDWYQWMRREYGEQVGHDVFARISPRMWRKHGTWAGAIWAHDEIQAYLHNDLDHQLISEKCVEIISHQQAKFNFRVPLTGEAKIGENWATTH